MKKENKILVSGGFGFIGTNLINHLLKKGFEIGVIDFVNNNKFKNITKYKKLSWIKMIKECKKFYNEQNI